MQKGYKRGEAGMAVLKFFIGLIIVAIIVGVIYFFLQKVDYSDKLKNPDATMRPYVEVTDAQMPTGGTTVALSDPELANDFSGEAITSDLGNETDSFDLNDENAVLDLTGGDDAFDFGGEDDVLDLTGEDDAFDLDGEGNALNLTGENDELDLGAEFEEMNALDASADEETTPDPTPISEATPTPAPTPEPTAIPDSMFAVGKVDGFSVPQASTDAKAEITNLYISYPNGGGVVQMKGYAFMDHELFDTSKLAQFLIVTQKSSGRQIAYMCQKANGASGDPHIGALCPNPSDADFEIVVDMSKYSDGEYGLGVVLYFAGENGASYSYYEFPQTITMVTGVATLSGADVGDATPFLPDSGMNAEAAAIPEEAISAESDAAVFNADSIG